MSLWFLVLLQSSKRFEFYEKKHECSTERLLCIIVCLLLQASAFNFLLHIAFVLTPYIIQLNTVVPYVWLIQLVILSMLLAQFSTWFSLVFIILLKHLLQFVIFFAFVHGCWDILHNLMFSLLKYVYSITAKWHGTHPVHFSNWLQCFPM